MDERLNVLLTDLLGQPDNPNVKWVYYKCPFCFKQGKDKRKFAVNSDTLQWKCWVCNTRGYNLFSLIRKLGMGSFRERIENTLKRISKNKEEIKTFPKIDIALPKEYVRLSDSKSFILKNKVLKYLSNRNIGEYEIRKYDIGFCMDGGFSNRIIIPSYDINNNLNYFTARSLDKHEPLKYLNPKVERNDIIVFENLIDWDRPVVLTQGMFDAMTVNFNAIPLMGKIIGNKLMEKLLYYDCDVYFSLDNDAQKDQHKMINKVSKKGLDNLYYINLKEKDPNDMGREQYWKYLNKTLKKFTVSSNLDMLKQQVNGVRL